MVGGGRGVERRVDQAERVRWLLSEKGACAKPEAQRAWVGKPLTGQCGLGCLALINPHHRTGVGN